MSRWGGHRLRPEPRESRAHSESLLSELDPLVLLLPDSEELLLLSREGPPDAAEPDFSGGDAQVSSAHPHTGPPPRHPRGLSCSPRAGSTPPTHPDPDLAA